MEPAVPRGAVMIIPDGHHQPGDVVAWWRQVRGHDIEGALAPFGIFDDARPARLAPRQREVTITFDNRPNEEPLVGPPGRVGARMSAYIPLLGYVLWPGPIGLALIFIAALAVLYLTRHRAE